VGETFLMGRKRLAEIRRAPAFQCHKTINWSKENYGVQPQPQQCAGLMAVLHRENDPNQIMQVAMRFGHLDPKHLDPDNEAYDTWDDALKAHTWQRDKGNGKEREKPQDIV
jgi:hypothetical protein